MAESVYVLCALTSLACAALLLRSYGRSRMKLILWTSLCFIGLAINNVLLVVDLAIVREFSLLGWRHFTALAAVAVLLYGLISAELT